MRYVLNTCKAHYNKSSNFLLAENTFNVLHISYCKISITEKCSFSAKSYKFSLDSWRPLKFACGHVPTDKLLQLGDIQVQTN